MYISQEILRYPHRYSPVQIYPMVMKLIDQFWNVQGDNLCGRLGHHKNQIHPWLKDPGKSHIGHRVLIIPIQGERHP